MIADRDDHGRHHDREVVGHADRGDDRVEREDDVEQHDLNDHRAERRRHPRRAVPLLAFEPLVDLERRLGEQEQARRQDQDRDRGPRTSWPNTVKSGAVRRMIQASDISSRMRITIAAIRPSAPRPRC